MRFRPLRVALLAVLCIVLLGAKARQRQQPAKTGNAPAFDYFLLSLSWAPDFCAEPGRKDPLECGDGRRLGFIVHGLWPNNNGGRGPQNCPSSPVADPLVQRMLSYIPSESLIQHEWKTHGSCSGLSADDYFAMIRRLRDSLRIPASFQSLSSPAEMTAAAVEAAFASANPAMPKAAFTVSCLHDRLEEVRICYDHQGKPRACTPTSASCPIPSMEILPPK
jgi:ribonuclease T2